jgi:hypothetical protein
MDINTLQQANNAGPCGASVLSKDPAVMSLMSLLRASPRAPRLKPTKIVSTEIKSKTFKLEKIREAMPLAAYFPCYTHLLENA